MSMNRFPLLIAAAALFAALPLQADFPKARNTVDVSAPFAFVVAGTEFPAGEYRIEDHSAPNVLVVRSLADPAMYFAAKAHRVSPTQNDATPKAVFKVENGERVLHQVWSPEGGRQLAPLGKAKNAAGSGASIGD